MKPQASLTDPDPGAPERARRLADLIRAEIRAQPDGVIGFDRFMALALYTPDLGYYSGARDIFGHTGDFVTAPESGPLFARCIARQLAPLFGDARPRIVEYGAGSGALAAELIASLHATEGAAALDYHIVEPSASLRSRQRERLRPLADSGCVKLSWSDDHVVADDERVTCAIANEVIDAMPARRYVRGVADVEELVVGAEGDEFCWRTRAPADCPDFIRTALGDFEPGYATEWIPRLDAWLADVAAGITRGLFLVADYGYPEHEFLHPARCDGTLRVYGRHRAHDDPFAAPGCEDLSTSVNFTELARLAEDAGFAVRGFLTQARFLVNAGIDAVLQASMNGTAAHDYALAQEAKRLLLPGEMGQTCKLMALARGDVATPSAFADDERHRLLAPAGARSG